MNRCLAQFFVAVALALLVAPVDAGTYKWVDKDGNVHYSDTPVEGAEEVDLPEPMVFDAPEVPPPAEAPAEAAEPETPGYVRFAFISPKQDQVFWNTAGRIPVQLDLEPALQPGDEIALFFNGERIVLQGLGTTLTDVYRGTYSVRAAIIGEDGKEIAATAPVQFHVRQRSIANPP